MRAPIRLCTLLGLSLALLAPCAAHADITPIPKPPEASAEPSVGHKDAVVAPLARPQQVEAPAEQTPAVASTAAQTSTAAKTSTPAAKPTLARSNALEPALSEGGRELPVAPESSEGGRDASASRRSVLATVMPVPLGLVGLHEALPAYQTYPSWLLALFALMATAEAFLLTHLLRTRRADAAAAAAEAQDLDDLNRL
jgi:hypothetical protein